MKCPWRAHEEPMEGRSIHTESHGPLCDVWLGVLRAEDPHFCGPVSRRRQATLFRHNGVFGVVTIITLHNQHFTR